MSIHVVSKKVKAFNSEDTFLRVDEDTVLTEAFEDEPHVLLMLFGGSTCNQQIINVYA